MSNPILFYSNYCRLIWSVSGIVLLASWLISHEFVAGASLPETQMDPVEELAKLKGNLKSSKQKMCSFLLNQVSIEDVTLTLERVVELFKQALDHMGKSSDYAALIRPHVNPKVIEDFDNNGGNFVLEVSDNIRKLLSDYKAAATSPEKEKYSILEKYFYKACANKLGTIIAEKSMFESFQNMEAKLKAKEAAIAAKKISA